MLKHLYINKWRLWIFCKIWHMGLVLCYFNVILSRSIATILVQVLFKFCIATKIRQQNFNQLNNVVAFKININFPLHHGVQIVLSLAELQSKMNNNALVWTREMFTAVDTDIFVTGHNGSCIFYNNQCRQWQQFRQHVDTLRACVSRNSSLPNYACSISRCAYIPPHNKFRM